MRIVIIGSGNVATVLGRKLLDAGHSVLQVLGRNNAHAAALAAELKAVPVSDPQDISGDADLYLVAISDSELPSLSSWLRVADKLVVHTAGSMPMNILDKVSARHGVLYPLQTLRREAEPGTIPLLIDASEPASLDTIRQLALSISPQVQQANDEYRSRLHVAAVVVNNFTNHLYALAEEFCRAEGLDFSLLYPLISESAGRLRQHSPSAIRTGPAARNDRETIGRHLSLLARHPELSRFYQFFTENILQRLHQ